MQTKRKSSDLLKSFLHKDKNVLFAVLFGSIVNEQLKKESDIDIGIYFKTPLNGLDLLDYMTRLASFFDREIDLVVLNNSSPFLRHQVMKNKMNIIIKNENIYQRFREKTISDYDEYKYISGMDIYDR